MNLGMIFDMDGVLIDSENFYFGRRMQFFKEKNILPGSTNKLDFVGLTENGIWEVLVSEKDQRADLKKEYLAYREKHPIDFKTALRKGAEDILDYLKKKSIKIALASSSKLKLYLSINAADKIVAKGFAIPIPAISGALP